MLPGHRRVLHYALLGLRGAVQMPSVTGYLQFWLAMTIPDQSINQPIDNDVSNKKT